MWNLPQKYSQVHKYLDTDEVIVILDVYHNILEMNLNNEYASEKQVIIRLKNLNKPIKDSAKISGLDKLNIWYIFKIKNILESLGTPKDSTAIENNCGNKIIRVVKGTQVCKRPMG